MKKLFGTFFMVLMVLTLSGCIGESTLTLKNGNEDPVTYTAFYGNTVQLPYIEKEGFLFVGYSDGENLYFDEYKLGSSITLEARFERLTDVFKYEINDDYQETITLTEYTGNGKHLLIPEKINGHLVSGLASYMFQDSDIVQISLPVDTQLNYYTFSGSTKLERVHFYGDYQVFTEKWMMIQEFQDLIEDNNCEIKETTGEFEWEYKSGCPVHKVIGKSDTTMIGDMEYFNYRVLMDLNYYTESFMDRMGLYTFEGATSLESINIPKETSYIFPETFKGCTSLSKVTVDPDNEYLKSIDGVIYDKEVETLIYYPLGISKKTYTLPSTVTSINPGAFLENTKIETLKFSENFENGYNFAGLLGVEQFKVDEKNESFTVSNGVLYKGDILAHYPANKPGKTFTVPEGITEIAAHAFDSNQNLESIDFGNELTKIGGYAFLDSVRLTELNLPRSVEEIGLYINMNSNIDTITVNSLTLPTLIDDFAPFKGSYTIYVPSASIDAYKNGVNWSKHKENIKEITE